MRLKSFLLTLYLTIIFFAQSCTEKSDPMYDYQATWKCHFEKDWTYESTRSKIIGHWEWKYIKCCGETINPYQNSTESEGLIIEFNSDGTGKLLDRDTYDEFTWDIRLVDNELFGFEIIPRIPQLYGRLLLCDNLMISNHSYIDGADNYFVKIEVQNNLR